MLTREIVLNILFLSIPEEFFITVIILVLLKRYDFLRVDRWKENLIKIMGISAIPISVISNILKITVKNDNIELFINMFLFSITIAILCEVRSLKQYLKVMICTFFGFVLFMITELITMYIIVFILKTDIPKIDNNIITKFILFLPERMIQYGIITIVHLKKNSIRKVGVVEKIVKNPYLRVIVVISIILNLTLLITSMNRICYGSILQNMLLEDQIFMIATQLTLIIYNLLLIWFIALAIYPNEKYKNDFRKDD